MIRENLWASRALDEVKKVQGTDKESKFRTQCLRAPSLIQSSGLAQAISFLASRGGDCGPELVAAFESAYGVENLRESAVEERELATYMVLTRDVMAIAAWFRRFAQSELRAPDDVTVDGDVAAETDTPQEEP